MQNYIIKYHVTEYDIKGNPCESHSESLAAPIQAHDAQGAARLALGRLRSHYAKQENMFCQTSRNGMFEVWTLFKDWTGENEIMKVLSVTQLTAIEAGEEFGTLFI